MNAVLRWFGDAVVSGAERALERGLVRAVENEARAMNRTVPRRTGALAHSQRIRGKGAERVIAYTAHYAVPVHEHIHERHPGGGRAKWAELTHLEEEQKSIETVGDELRVYLAAAYPPGVNR